MIGIAWESEMTLLDYMVPLQISDFGMTREVESEMYYMLSKGTVIPVKWTAPEAILFRKYTTKSDIWSYGMLMYEIWSLGHKPFESNTVQEVSCSWFVWFLQCTELVVESLYVSFGVCSWISVCPCVLASVCPCAYACVSMCSACVSMCSANVRADGAAPGCPLLPPPSPWLPKGGVLCHGGLLVRECAAVSGAGCVHPLPTHTQMSAELYYFGDYGISS